MLKFEHEYFKILKDLHNFGERRQTRNAETLSQFGKVLVIDQLEDGYFPLLQSRKMFYKGVLGELAAFVHGPKSVQDFEQQGCNYWKLWGKEDGSINVDYGNSWLDFNGYNQLRALVQSLKADPASRRHIISAWKPDNLDKLDLPCCHYAYQWYVTNDGKLEMLWHQRSADWVIGVPSDIILAAAMNIALANEVGLKPGKITMTFGDAHIYSSHLSDLALLYNQYSLAKSKAGVVAAPTYVVGKELTLTNFSKDLLKVNNYNHQPPIKFKLEA